MGHTRETCRHVDHRTASLGNSHGDAGPACPGPGSTQNGADVDLTAGPQTVQLIAFFLDEDGNIVAPPSGSASVSFSLDNVSALPGIAMNAGSGTAPSPDFSLVSSSAQFGSDLTARVNLRVLDYGGYGRVSASHSGLSAQQWIPKGGDQLPTSMPPLGWTAADASVVPGGGSPGADSETGPDAAATGGSGNANTGDGLTAFEEYRGFFIRGQHVRLDPAKKDLFVASDFLNEGHGFADNLKIKVWDVDPAEIGPQREINFNGSNLPGVSSHYLQRALRIQDGGFKPNVAAETQPIALGPVVPQNVAGITVYSGSIRALTPTRYNDVDIDDPIDDETLRQTIAHEIGHSVNLGDHSANFVCPLPASFEITVMITRFYQQGNLPNPTNGFDPMCAWQFPIPHVYRPVELDTFRLK